MSDDRLKELLRQRALLAEHLAWLDREIAASHTRDAGALTPVPTPVPLPVAVTSPSPAPTLGQPRSPLFAAPPPAADVDALFDRLRTEEKSRGQFSKKGCWLVFAVLMLVGLVGVAALIFLRYR